MSHFSHATIACPACGEPYAADVADSLHVSTRRDLREDILAGRFHRFACPGCGAAATVEKLLAYTDFERWHWLTVVPPAELPAAAEWRRFAQECFQKTMVERCPDLVRRSFAPRMLRRVVFGLASLREKLLCFDAGLDDRLLELLKLDLLRELGLLRPPGTPLHFHLDAAAEDELAFSLGLPGAPPARVAVPRERLDPLAASAAELERRFPALFSDIIVDLRAPAGLLEPQGHEAAAAVGG